MAATEIYRTVCTIYVEAEPNKKGKIIIDDKMIMKVYEALPWTEKIMNVNVIHGVLTITGDTYRNYCKKNPDLPKEDFYRKLGEGLGKGKKGGRAIYMSVTKEAVTMLKAFATKYELGFVIPEMEIAKPHGGKGGPRDDEA